MINKIFAAFFLISAFVSCRSNSGFKYSENFVARERKLIPAIDSTEDKVEAYLTAAHFDSMAIVSSALEKRIGDVVKDIKAESAPEAKEGERFKGEVIRYFEFMKHVYTVYVEFANAPAEQRADILVKLQDIVKQKPEVIQRIKQAQKDFAKANGFRMEKE